MPDTLPIVQFQVAPDEGLYVLTGDGRLWFSGWKSEDWTCIPGPVNDRQEVPNDQT